MSTFTGFPTLKWSASSRSFRRVSEDQKTVRGTVFLRMGRPRVDERRILSGIIFINRNGLRWRGAPKEQGPARTLFNRWKRWSDNGVFAGIMVMPGH